MKLKTMRCYVCDGDFKPNQMHQIYLKGSFADTVIYVCENCFEYKR